MLKNLKIFSKVLVVAILLIISLVFFSVLLFTQFEVISIPLKANNINNLTQIQNQTSLSQVANNIRYYDEVLTQSARNYTLTGQERWKTRYNLHANKLNQELIKAKNLAQESQYIYFEQIDSINTQLIELEEEAIKLTDQESLEDAFSILEGENYQTYKQQYTENINEYFNSQQKIISNNIDLSIKSNDEVVQNTNNLISRSRLLAIFLTSVITLLATLLAYALARDFRSSINNILKAFENLRENKKTKINVEERNDEFGFLSKEFNLMASIILDANNKLEHDVKLRTKELEKKSKNLEKIIKERTKELQEEKTKLDTKVSERTQELDKKVKQLEKLNQFMTDRELKIAKLKKEIEKLKKKAN